VVEGLGHLLVEWFRRRALTGDDLSGDARMAGALNAPRVRARTDDPNDLDRQLAPAGTIDEVLKRATTAG